MPANSIGQVNNEFNQALANNTSGSNLDKEAFLLLLVTQFQYQDPLNPMDDKEFISQMAQFSSLEQMMNLNESMQGITDAVNNQSMFNATSYIGKYVTTTGNVIGKTSSSVTGEDGQVTTTSTITPYYYTFNGDVSKATIQVFDNNNQLVYTENLGGMSQYNSDGTLAVYKFAWNGLNSKGEAAADGTYKITVSGEDGAGNPVLVGTQLVADRVTDVLRNGSDIMLRLQGGQYMSLGDVEQVSESDPEISTVPGGDDEGDGGDGADGGDGTDGGDGGDGEGAGEGTETQKV